MQTKLIIKSLVLNEDGKLLILLRGTTAPRRPLQWDLPGGFVEKDEQAVDAVKRETYEETGLDIDVQNFHLIFAFTKMWDEGNGVHLYYGVKVKNPDVKISWEHDEFMWVTIDEAIDLIKHSVQLDALKYISDNKVEI